MVAEPVVHGSSELRGVMEKEAGRTTGTLPSFFFLSVAIALYSFSNLFLLVQTATAAASNVSLRVQA